MTRGPALRPRSYPTPRECDSSRRDGRSARAIGLRRLGSRTAAALRYSPRQQAGVPEQSGLCRAAASPRRSAALPWKWSLATRLTLGSTRALFSDSWVPAGHGRLLQAGAPAARPAGLPCPAGELRPNSPTDANREGSAMRPSLLAAIGLCFGAAPCPAPSRSTWGLPPSAWTNADASSRCGAVGGYAGPRPQPAFEVATGRGVFRPVPCGAPARSCW